MEDPVLDPLRAALAAAPQNADLRLALVRLLLQKHRYPEAADVAADGLKGGTRHGGLSLALAEACYAQGRFGEAIVILEGRGRCGAGDAEAELWMARCHFQQEEHKAARDAYRRAQELDPTICDDQLSHFGQRSEPARREEAEPLLVGGDPDAAYVPLQEKAKVTFADVGGMERVKEEIRMKVIHPLQQPELFAAYGKKAGGGILMYGPPGCGKTLMARATAGEVDAAFFNVSISQVLSKYIGESERNLRDVFVRARSARPAVLFFDEVDALAASRRDLRESAGRNVINEFLSQLDGMESDNDDLLVIGATNAPWYLDTAFRRPGRFERILFVPPPDEPARAAILDLLLRDKPAAQVDKATVAKKARDYSGADLRHLVDRAVEDKLAVAMKSGKPEPLTTKDLLKAMKSARPTTTEWFAQARNHALYANEGGLYDDVLEYLGIRK